MYLVIYKYYYYVIIEKKKCGYISQLLPITQALTPLLWKQRTVYVIDNYLFKNSRERHTISIMECCDQVSEAYDLSLLEYKRLHLVVLKVTYKCVYIPICQVTDLLVWEFPANEIC